MNLVVPYKLKRQIAWYTPFFVKKPAKKFISHLRKSQVKSYYVAENGLNKFFEALNTEKIQYVVYKWKTTSSGDFDILINDADAQRVIRKLNYETKKKSNGCVHIDVHTVYGTGGGKLFFPPKIGKEILESAILGPNRVSVPNPETQLKILAFHCVYNLGSGSGISFSDERNKMTVQDLPKQGHNYFELLHYLFLSQGNAQFEISMENLIKYLEKNNWNPTIDFLIFKGRTNEFIKKLVSDELAKYESSPGLAMFFFRREAKFEENYDEIRRIIESHNFHILDSYTVDKQMANRIFGNIRGGNWYQDIPHLNGGPVTNILWLEDKSPRSSKKDRRFLKFPRDNAKTEVLKEELRFSLRRLLGTKSHLLHASDSSAQALMYRDIIGL